MKVMFRFSQLWPSLPLRSMWHSMTAQQVGYRLSWVALLSRMVALAYALGILSFYPHPTIAARSEMLLELWACALGYTLILLVLLLSRLNHWLRSAPFLVLDWLVAMVIVNLAGGGYRNIFSLYSLIPPVTTALTLPSAERPLRRALLLAGIVVASTLGFGLSLLLDGYTLERIIQQRQVDEVVLRSASYWVTGGLLAVLAGMMIAWQYSRDRANALREQAAVEEERRRIATDIHDGVLSQLSALGRRAEYASLLLSEDVQAAQQELARVVALAGEAHEGIRWIVRALSQDPAQLTLSGELTRSVERFARNTGMRVDLRLPAREPAVSVDAVRHLGYIVTEALTNAWKHAGVKQASVVVRPSAGRLLVQITDNGRGFDPAAPGGYRAGFGVRNMRERAQEIGADLDIRSHAGGTTVSISMPLQHEQEMERSRS